jgi:hypothetical protein
MKSKTKLFADLEKIDPVYFKGVNLNDTNISNETYGRDSRIYIRCETFADRKSLENKLERLGYKIDPNYSPSDNRLEVQVSYFKGWHWDE